MFFDLCTEDEVEDDDDEGEDGDLPLPPFTPLPFFDLSSSL